MEPISEGTLQQVEDVMRGIAVPPADGWLGSTVHELCAAIRTLQTERAALAAYTQAQKDQAWNQTQQYRGAVSYSHWRHWDGQRLAYADILTRLTTDAAPGPAPLMDVLAELAQQMGDYD